MRLHPLIYALCLTCVACETAPPSSRPLTHEQAPGAILSVFQAGYMLHDRLLREAQVVVARAPDPAPEDTGDTDADV